MNYRVCKACHSGTAEEVVASDLSREEALDWLKNLAGIKGATARAELAAKLSFGGTAVFKTYSATYWVDDGGRVASFA